MVLSFLQIAGAMPFSLFSGGKKRSSRRSTKRSKKRSTRRSTKRTGRRTGRRSGRTTGRVAVYNEKRRQERRTMRGGGSTCGMTLHPNLQNVQGGGGGFGGAVPHSHLNQGGGGGCGAVPQSQLNQGGGARRTSRRTSNRTSNRTSRRTSNRRSRKPRRTSRKPRRTTTKRSNRKSMRRSNREVRVRDLSKRKFKGKAGKYECVNGCDKNTKGYFTGKEPSPKGLGYCARCTPMGITMKGKDGNLWENKKYSKGKRWVKVREEMVGGYIRSGTF